jgi:hypothetical protein
MNRKGKFSWHQCLTLGLLQMGLAVCLSAPGFSYEIVETPEGLVLVKEAKTMAGGLGEGQFQEGARDPFTWAPAVVERQLREQRPVENKVFKQLVLTGILWDDTSPLAIIDGTVLKEGDEVRGAVIRSIYRDEVVLELDKDFYNLRFSELFELEKRQNQGEHIGPGQ